MKKLVLVSVLLAGSSLGGCALAAKEAPSGGDPAAASAPAAAAEASHAKLPSTGRKVIRNATLSIEVDSPAKILAQAADVDGAMKVHRELTGVRTEVDRLEGRKQFLETESSLATLALSLRPFQPTVGVSAAEIAASARRATSDAVSVAAGVVTFGIRAAGVIVPLSLLFGLPGAGLFWALRPATTCARKRSGVGDAWLLRAAEWRLAGTSANRVWPFAPLRGHCWRGGHGFSGEPTNVKQTVRHRRGGGALARVWHQACNEPPMAKGESATNNDKILQALRLLTRGETIPPADSDAEKAPDDDLDTEPTHSV